MPISIHLYDPKIILAAIGLDLPDLIFNGSVLLCVRRIPGIDNTGLHFVFHGSSLLYL
jgi:hypothetical protein